MMFVMSVIFLSLFLSEIIAISNAFITPKFISDIVRLKSTRCTKPPLHYGLNEYLDTLGTPTSKTDDSFSSSSAPPTPAAVSTPHMVPSSSPSSSIIRRPIMAGNWKLNPETYSDAVNLLKLLTSNFINHRNTAAADGSSMDMMPEVVVFPPYPFLSVALEELEGTGIKVGAQNIGMETVGAFTGEVSVSQVRSLGCDYVMLGHSERRALYGESDNDINTKIHLCLSESPGLSIILCVGETEEEYENNLLESIVDVQIKKALMGVSAADVSHRIVVAYEPVWAIGTGKVATPEQAQIAHVAVRKAIEEIYGTDVAQCVRIQYGGSVKPDNVESLMTMSDVDGALVGGACLTADSFTRIVDGATIPP